MRSEAQALLMEKMNELIIGSGQFEKYDVTLRDGAQDPRARYSVDKKMRTALLLQEFGMTYIEGGWPGANEGDTEFFGLAKEVLKQSQLVAFGMTIKNTVPSKDKNIKALLASGTEVVTLVGKTWEQNVERSLPISSERNIDNIYKSVKYLTDKGIEVFFDAEHWFDSYSQNPNYAFRSLEAALTGGVTRLVLCDTRGASTDRFVYKAVSAAVAKFPNAKFGFHAHQDSELAVINSIRAWEAGAVQLQATFNGIGERSGNANWCSLLPTAQFKYGIETGLDLTKLTSTAHAIALISGIPVALNAPYVGYYAFAHKGGLHASGQERDLEAYEHIRPEWVGNKRIYVFSEQSGSAHLEYMLKAHGYNMDRKSFGFRSLLSKLKQHPCFGEAQEALFLNNSIEKRPMSFIILEGSGVEDFRPLPPKAFVDVQVNGNKYREESIGDGPLNAFDIALKNALIIKYPEVNDVKLLGYGISLPNGDSSTAAEVEVCVKIEFRGKEITSIIRGTNQQRASEDALVDAYNYCIDVAKREKGLVA